MTRSKKAAATAKGTGTIAENDMKFFLGDALMDRTEDVINKMKVSDLQDICVAHDLSKAGLKSTLVKTLMEKIQAMKDAKDAADNEEDADDEEDDEESVLSERVKKKAKKIVLHTLYLSLVYRTYRGKKQNGEEWTADFLNLVADPGNEKNAVHHQLPRCVFHYGVLQTSFWKAREYSVRKIAGKGAKKGEFTSIPTVPGAKKKTVDWFVSAGDTDKKPMVTVLFTLTVTLTSFTS